MQGVVPVHAGAERRAGARVCGRSRCATFTSFREDDVIEIISMEDEVWWQGKLRGKVGLFPASYVDLL